MPVEASRPSRLPSLDGWRAVSILMVLAAHSGEVVGCPPAWRTFFGWGFDGNLGVRMFFIISGFIITWLLLQEHDRTGRVNLVSFYARRGLRILPVYAAFLTVLALLQAFTPYSQSTATWMGNLTFTTNFGRHNPWPGAHLWSLAVEEQFYLIWPVLLAMLGVARDVRWAWWILAPALCLAPIFRVVSYLHALPGSMGVFFLPFSFFNYFDSLAIGCVAAVLLARWPDEVLRRVSARPGWLALLAGAMILGPHLCTRFLAFAEFSVPLGPTVQALGLTLLLLQSLAMSNSGFYSLLNRPWVCGIGILSYSLYIWQQLFCSSPRLFGLEPPWWMSFPFWPLPVFVAALASYYGLERPLLRLRHRLR